MLPVPSGSRRLLAFENVTFLEQSFAEALTASMPRLDFIALHGVWSWISGENRCAIVDFINTKLKPGGVVYISYNALPAGPPMRPCVNSWWSGCGEKLTPLQRQSMRPRFRRARSRNRSCLLCRQSSQRAASGGDFGVTSQLRGSRILQPGLVTVIPLRRRCRAVGGETRFCCTKRCRGALRSALVEPDVQQLLKELTGLIRARDRDRLLSQSAIPT